MSMRETIQRILSVNPTLAGLLPGGIYTEEISLQNTPDAFDGNGDLLACGLIRQESETAAGTHRSAGRVYLAIYLYQRDSSDEIEAAASTIFGLLDDQQVEGSWLCRWVNDTPNIEDPGLRCRLWITRYEIVRVR